VPIDAPISTEIADVTVIAVWRALQNSQNTRPENRQAYRAGLGRQVGERRVGDAGRQQVGGQRDAGHHVGAHRRRAQRRQPMDRGHHPAQQAGLPDGGHFGHQLISGITLKGWFDSL
jgi:hypothetical protein